MVSSPRPNHTNGSQGPAWDPCLNGTLFCYRAPPAGLHCFLSPVAIPAHFPCGPIHGHVQPSGSDSPLGVPAESGFLKALPWLWESLSECGGGSVTKWYPILVTPKTVVCQAPLFIGFSRQAYWSSLHFLLQRIFPIQGSNLGLLHCRQIPELPGKIVLPGRKSYQGSPKYMIYLCGMKVSLALKLSH